MKITTAWLKDHLDTKLNENQIIDKLTDIGLEVEGVDSQSGELDEFIIAKILKAEKHPDADRLRVCDVDIGSGEPVKVVCGAPNAKEGLLTIYAPPGAVVPKSQMKLVVSKIRGVTSYGMLCSESELNLSNESDGITELLPEKYNKKIGENYFPKKNLNVIDISITPNRADCLGVRGIARDLAAAGAGILINQKEKKLDKKNKQTISVKIENENAWKVNVDDLEDYILDINHPDQKIETYDLSLHELLEHGQNVPGLVGNPFNDINMYDSNGIKEGEDGYDPSSTTSIDDDLFEDLTTNPQQETIMIGKRWRVRENDNSQLVHFRISPEISIIFFAITISYLKPIRNCVKILENPLSSKSNAT
mgnify:CR=1 FL=1